MVDLSSEINQYLVKNEKVDKQFSFRDCRLYLSQYRVLIKRGNSVTDIKYDTISGLELKVRRNYWLINIGLAILIITFVFRLFDPPNWALNTPEGRLMYSYGIPWFYIIPGFILLGVGYLFRNTVLSMTGHNQKHILIADKETLNTLYRILNERRFQSKH